MSRDEIAVLDGATFAYGSVVAVRNASFTIREGEYVCLIGRNGCGKSTLLKGMLGLIEPMAGTIDLKTGLDAVAFLPQTHGAEPDFPATVWEVALSGCQRRGKSLWYSADDKRTVRKCLEELGIADLAGKRMGRLSGGQRQRAYLARCLCRGPRLLLLDEPYTGLDPETAGELSEMLLRFRDQGIAILMSSHDLGAVAACANRVLVLETDLIFDGDVAEWLARYNRVDFLPDAKSNCRPRPMMA